MRKWDAKIKAKIVLEGLENKVPLAELCNQRYHRCLNQEEY